MLTYNDIINDKTIKAILSKIDYNDQKLICSHGTRHAYSCITIARSLFDEFKINPIYLQETLIACSLHDIGNLGGKHNHAKRSYKFAKIFLKGKLLKTSKKRILTAIKNHSKTRKKSSIIEKVLVCSDKLDMSKTRLMPNGHNYKGMRQSAFINQIKTIKKLDYFVVEFIVTNQFNINEWNNYYFTKKIIKAVNNLAKTLGLKPKIEYKKAWFLMLFCLFFVFFAVFINFLFI